MPEITLAELNDSSAANFVAALSNVFEYSPWIAEQAAATRPFTGINALYHAMGRGGG